MMAESSNKIKLLRQVLNNFFNIKESYLDIKNMSLMELAIEKAYDLGIKNTKTIHYNDNIKLPDNEIHDIDYRKTHVLGNLVYKLERDIDKLNHKTYDLQCNHKLVVSFGTDFIKDVDKTLDNLKDSGYIKKVNKKSGVDCFEYEIVFSNIDGVFLFGKSRPQQKLI